MMEAYCELDLFQNAYETTRLISRLSPKDDILHVVRDSIASHTCSYENSSEFNTFFYNLAAVHSRDQSHIVEAHQYIQKILTQMGLNPSTPTANIPLPTVDLLIHYYLRTQKFPEAIQMIKRKRTLTVNSLQGVQGASNVRPVLNITK